MTGYTDQVLKYLFGTGNFEEVEVVQLKELVEEYPCFHVGHYLLSKKLKTERYDEFLRETQKTALHFNNPLWLEWLLVNNSSELSLDVNDGGTDGRNHEAPGSNAGLSLGMEYMQPTIGNGITQGSMEFSEEGHQSERISGSQQAPGIEIPTGNSDYARMASWTMPALALDQQDADRDEAQLPDLLSDHRVEGLQNDSIKDIPFSTNPDTQDRGPIEDTIDAGVFTAQSASNLDLPVNASWSIKHETFDVAYEPEADNNVGEISIQSPDYHLVDLTTSDDREIPGNKPDRLHPEPKIDIPGEIPDTTVPEKPGDIPSNLPDSPTPSTPSEIPRPPDKKDAPATETGIPPEPPEKIPKEITEIPALPETPESEEATELPEIPTIGDPEPSTELPLLAVMSERDLRTAAQSQEQIIATSESEGRENNVGFDFPKQSIVDGTAASPEFTFDPFHTVDYFASLGIKYVPEENPVDKFGKRLKSFTDWLKVMKKLPQPSAAAPPDEIVEKEITSIAAHSNEQKEVITETMAEVLRQQGKVDKAIAIYLKLSFLHPAKSAYFAAKIQELKTQQV